MKATARLIFTFLVVGLASSFQPEGAQAQSTAPPAIGRSSGWTLDVPMITRMARTATSTEMAETMSQMDSEYRRFSLQSGKGGNASQAGQEYEQMLTAMEDALYHRVRLSADSVSIRKVEGEWRTGRDHMYADMVKRMLRGRSPADSTGSAVAHEAQRYRILCMQQRCEFWITKISP